MTIPFTCQSERKVFQVAVIGRTQDQIPLGAQHPGRKTRKRTREIKVLDNFRGNDNVKTVGVQNGGIIICAKHLELNVRISAGSESDALLAGITANDIESFS